MNSSLLIILRVLHEVGGALWVGVAEIFRFFIQPAVKALGKESQKFGQALNDRNRFLKFIGEITR
jgi:hypothetical protein